MSKNNNRSRKNNRLNQENNNTENDEIVVEATNTTEKNETINTQTKTDEILCSEQTKDNTTSNVAITSEEKANETNNDKNASKTQEQEEKALAKAQKKEEKMQAKKQKKRIKKEKKELKKIEKQSLKARKIAEKLKMKEAKQKENTACNEESKSATNETQKTLDNKTQTENKSETKLKEKSNTNTNSTDKKSKKKNQKELDLITNDFVCNKDIAILFDDEAENKDKKRKTITEMLEDKKRQNEIRQREKRIRKQKENALNEIRQKWYKLDNSALIYPAICNDEWNSVFRIAAVLKEPVDENKLQQALDHTIDRFPLFNVSFREGFFWPYFQPLTKKPQVQLETDPPCRPFIFKKDAHILRVLYYNKKISLEFFHSLSDGYGAVRFFNIMLVEYLELCGIPVPDKAEFGLGAFDKPVREESEDSFKKYASKTTIRSRKEKKAYAINDEILLNGNLRAFNACGSVKELKSIAKKYNCTVNEFLSAVYLSTLLEHKKLNKKDSSKPVKLSVPVNIRKNLPSQTMRNFSIVLNVEVPLEKENAPFEELIELVKSEMSKLDENYVVGFISKNVASETNPFVRILPLFIKKPIIRAFYSQIGEILFTSTITNMGLNKVPQTVIDHVDSFQAVLGVTKLNRLNLAIMSVGDTICLTLTSRLIENSLARDFFTRLASFGFHIRLESNN